MGAIANDAPLSQDDYRLLVIAKGHLRTRDQSQLPETLSILRKLTRDNPEFGAGWALLANGTAFDFTRGPKVDRDTLMAEAQDYIERGLEVAPNSPDVLSIAGLLAQDPSRVREYLEQAVAMDPGDAQSHFWLGHSKNGHGDSASAMVSYENVLRLDPLWTRAGTLPEYPAARGDVDRADGWDRLIIAAAGEAWQADLARSRIARRNGRWAEFIRLMRQSHEKAPRGRQNWIKRRELSAIAFLGLDVPDDVWNPRWSPGRRALQGALLKGNAPPAGSLQPGKDGDLWASQVVPVIGPRVLYANGQGALLLRLFDESFDPELINEIGSRGGIMADFDVMPAIPYLVMALRDAGRAGEAETMRNNALQSILPAAVGQAPIMDLMLAAKLTAVAGDLDQAMEWLKKARQAGWPHAMNLSRLDVFQPLAEDPAFAGLKGNAEFEALSKAVEAERERERAAFLAAGA